MPKPNENVRRDYSIFDNMSTEKLEDILRADFQLPSRENADTDTILYIMEVIAKRENEYPTGKFNDVETAWADFNKNYLPYAKDNKCLYDYNDIEQIGKQKPFVKSLPPMKNHRLLRAACVITVTITTLLLAGTITASAMGIDLWGVIAEWTKDTFRFTNATTDTQIIQEANSSSQYKSLKDALDSYAVTEKLVPTWFPEGYSLKNISINETPVQIIINAKYSNTSSEISINITLSNVPSDRTYEKDGNDVIVYSKNEIEHYIMSNLDQTNIVWQTENVECSISGTLTLEEAKEIIDSIYERN